MSLEAIFWKVEKPDHIKYNIQLTGSTKKEMLAAAGQLKDWDLMMSKYDHCERLDTKILSKDFDSEERWQNFEKSLSFPLQEISFKFRRIRSV